MLYHYTRDRFRDRFYTHDSSNALVALDAVGVDESLVGGSDIANSIAINGQRVFVTGAFEGEEVVFGGQNQSPNAISSTDGSDIFVWALDIDSTSGVFEFAWITQAFSMDGTHNDDEGRGIAVLSSGQVIVAGRYDGLRFLLPNGNLVVSTRANFDEIFVLSVAEVDGTPLSLSSAGGDQSDTANDVAPGVVFESSAVVGMISRPISTEGVRFPLAGSILGGDISHKDGFVAQVSEN